MDGGGAMLPKMWNDSSIFGYNIKNNCELKVWEDCVKNCELKLCWDYTFFSPKIKRTKMNENMWEIKMAHVCHEDMGNERKKITLNK